ncbi:hypothetical protein F2Q69_00050088 [Brassica cretica]|uniref:Uncharacterized protein n=1 Tax=Brassica cretica TaxID=69181 RepID=A0A8S9PWD4_BRACR|nr:hypothetical protein F2Q69_00050088 [Brassica cretica]
MRKLPLFFGSPLVCHQDRNSVAVLLKRTLHAQLRLKLHQWCQLPTKICYETSYTEARARMLKLAARIESLTSVSAVGKAVTLIRRLKILRERERSVPEPLPNLACLRSSLDLGRNLSGVKDNRCSCPIWPVVGDDGMEFDGCEKAVTAR